jgi:hypothetical protein
MKRSLILAGAVVAVSTQVPFAQEHLDALLTRDPGNPTAIPTGSFDFDGFAVVELPPATVYGNDLEEPAPGLDLLVGETGFTALGATAAASLLGGTGLTNLPGGESVRFDLHTFNLYGGPMANLFYWDGLDTNGNGDPADDIDFQPATGVTLALERAGLFSAAVDGSNANVPGFEIAVTALDDPGSGDDETGFLHEDLDAILDDGDSDPGTGLPLGIYVLAMNVSYDAASSDQLFWVYNAGLGKAGEPAHDAALEYVPEPAGALLLTLGGLLVIRRR